MKVAIQFAGQLRSFVQPLSFFKKQVLDHMDCDVFISTWESMPSQLYPDDEGSLGKFKQMCDVTAARTDKLTNTFQRPLIDICRNGWVIEGKRVKIAYMVYGFYHKYMCNQLRKRYEDTHNIKYDAIIMVRPDLMVAEPFPVHLLEQADDYLMIPLGSDWEWGINDLMAVSGRKYADQYCSLYQHLSSYVDDGVLIHPEHINRYNIEALKIPLRRFGYTTHLRARRMT